MGKNVSRLYDRAFLAVKSIPHAVKEVTELGFDLGYNIYDLLTLYNLYIQLRGPDWAQDMGNVVLVTFTGVLGLHGWKDHTFGQTLAAYVQRMGVGALSFEAFILLYWNLLAFTGDHALADVTFQVFCESQHGQQVLTYQLVSEMTSMMWECPDRANIDSLAAVMRAKRDVLRRDDFMDLVNTFPLLLLPVYQFQQSLRKGTLGERRWQELAQYNFTRGDDTASNEAMIRTMQGAEAARQYERRMARVESLTGYADLAQTMRNVAALRPGGNKATQSDVPPATTAPATPAAAPSPSAASSSAAQTQQKKLAINTDRDRRPSMGSDVDGNGSVGSNRTSRSNRSNRSNRSTTSSRTPVGSTGKTSSTSQRTGSGPGDIDVRLTSTLRRMLTEHDAATSSIFSATPQTTVPPPDSPSRRSGRGGGGSGSGGASLASPNSTRDRRRSNFTVRPAQPPVPRLAPLSLRQLRSPA